MLENDNSGFGKDYHGEDVFGGNIGGTNGGDGADRDSGFEAPDIDTNELSNTESSFEGEATSVGDSLRENIQGVNEDTAENSNTGSAMDTSFQIGGTEDEERARAERALHEAERREKAMGELIDEQSAEISKELDAIENASGISKIKDAILGKGGVSMYGSKVEAFADRNGFELTDEQRQGLKSSDMGVMREVLKAATDMAKNKLKSDVDKAKAEYDKLESSFTDKMKEDKPKTEDKPKETNMSKATPGKSDYETKANKDSTKEVPKETPSRNDYGNHAMDTLKGATDKLTNSFTAKALGLKSIEDFARENGYNPEKLSTMKAYQAYQNREIMKAIPGVMKQVGGYIVERIKDAFDPSQLEERVRNTLARYNIATLVGAVILSMNSGAGLQASLDQALTIVDPEDQTAVSDFLEDVLKDRDTVKDLSNAIDGALAPEENSATSELDEEIVNIGRKNNTDYDDFNAGIGTSASDADVKVFIARNIKADPILRRMVAKLGK